MALYPLQLEILMEMNFDDLAQDSADFCSIANPGHGEEIC